MPVFDHDTAKINFERSGDGSLRSKCNEALFRALLAIRQSDAAADLPCPAQALLAHDDMLVPATLARPAPDKISVQMIAGGGHSFHRDQPQAVAEHMRTFINTL